jgi:hypothetical protein
MYSSPSPRESSKLLTKTSFLFLIPGVYAFQHELYYYSLVLLLTTGISFNFWRKPVYGLRRNIDLVYAKLSFVIFFVSGVYYVRIYLSLYYTLLFLMLYYFQTAYVLSQKRVYNWYRYHALFHLIVAIEQFLILYAIKN